MSARDVDDEFEKAYRRLFSSSTATTDIDKGASSSTSSRPAHTAAGTSQPASARTPTSPTEDIRRKQARINLLSRQLLESKALLPSKQQRSIPVQTTRRSHTPQSRSLQSSLNALARQLATSNVKGKARARSNDGSETHTVEKAARRPTAPAAVTAHSAGHSRAGGVAYYPYPQGLQSYQVSAPLVNPTVTPHPGQAVTWTQPVVSAGMMPAVAYPGFSASVTFSQPQFFAPHPQQLPPAITALPTNAWQHSYTPQASGPITGPSSYSVPGQHDPIPMQTGTHRNPSTKLENTSTLDIDRPRTKRVYTKRKFILDAHGKRIWRNQAPRVRSKKLKTRDDVKPIVSAAQIKAEALEDTIPPTASSFSAAEQCLPLGEDAGLPYKMETHTLFVHSRRRLLWLARLAIEKAEKQTDESRPAMPSPLDPRQWARWTFLNAGEFQSLASEIDTAEPMPASSAPSTPVSQMDATGLFPRERRREYIALRKHLHTRVHTATIRMCISRLVRYLGKTAAAAERFELAQERRAYMERKHRPAKLAKHMLRSARPTGLDLRKMWSVWARAAHVRSKDASASMQQQRRRVSFAPQQASSLPLGSRPQTSLEEGVTIKLEPESPSAQRNMLGKATKIKAEPDSGGIRTPSPDDVRIKAEDGPLPVQGDRMPKRSPLFLRRNFRGYRLLGLSHLPLA